MSSADSGKPLRIGLCITELNVGGAERCLVELATGLDPARFTPIVYSLSTRPEPKAAALVERLERAGVPVHFFNGRGLRDAWRVLRELRRQLRYDHLDLLQTFLFHANVLGPVAARKADVPRVITGLRVAEPGRRWRRTIERRAGGRADRHVAVSEAVARFARDKIGLAADKIVVIPNGVAVVKHQLGEAAPDSAVPGLPEGRRFIVFVGRLDRQKGIDALIENAPRLLAELPEHDLLIVGVGSLDAQLRNSAAEMHLNRRIHFLGWRDDVAAILSAVDVFVAPSRWEGMSNAVLEAMAAGRALVAFRVEGIADLFGDRESPQIVPPGDWDGFNASAVKIASNERLRRELGAANYHRAATEFSSGQIIRRYEELFLALSSASE